MPGRSVIVLLAVYFALDFGNPLMPGAVCFEPSDCVEAVHLEPVRASASAAIVPAPPAAPRMDPAPADVAIPRRSQQSPPRRVMPSPQPAHAASVDAPPPGDDH